MVALRLSFTYGAVSPMATALRHNVNPRSSSHPPTAISGGDRASISTADIIPTLKAQQPSSSRVIMQSWSRYATRRQNGKTNSSDLVKLSIFLLLLFIQTSAAVYVEFENCLEPNIISTAGERQGLLQFEPYHVWASFNTSASSHTLNITVYGNVSGIATNETRPDWDDPQWGDDSKTLGKILDQDRSNNKFSTFFARFNVLDYTPYDAEPSRFCNSTINQQCPLGPAFSLPGNSYVPSQFFSTGQAG